MITNARPNSEYFHALIEFERDLLPAPSPASEPREVLGARHRILVQSRDVGSAQPPDSGTPSGGGCAEEFFPLSCLEPLEAV